MFIFLCFLMLLPGILIIIPGATIGIIINYFEISKSVAGLFPLSYFVGSIVGILSVGKLTSLFDSKKIISYSTFSLSLFLLFFISSKNFYLSTFLFLFIGFFGGLLLTFAGALITYSKGKNSQLYVNVLFFFFSIGVLTTPLVVNFLLEDIRKLYGWYFPWQIAYFYPALLSLFCGLISNFIEFTNIEKEKKNFISLFLLVLKKYAFFILLISVSVFLYVGSESVVNIWVSKFMSEIYPDKITYFQANKILTYIWIGIVFGRFISIIILKKIESFTLLVILNLLTFSFLGLAIFSKSYSISYLSFCLLGIGFSSVFPLLISYAGKTKKEYSDIVFSIFVGSGQIGGALLPYLVGVISEFYNFRVAFSILLICHFLIVILLIINNFTKH